MLTESLQELVSLLLLYNYHEGLLVSGTILNFIFLSFSSSFHFLHNSVQSLMYLIYFPFVFLFRCPLY